MESVIAWQLLDLQSTEMTRSTYVVRHSRASYIGAIASLRTSAAVGQPSARAPIQPGNMHITSGIIPRKMDGVPGKLMTRGPQASTNTPGVRCGSCHATESNGWSFQISDQTKANRDVSQS